MSFDARRLANAATRALRAYDPGHDLPALRHRFGDALVELGSNENVMGPSPRSIEAIEASIKDVFRYPDPKGGALKAAIASRVGADPAQVTLGNGSHELLMLIAQCFADSTTSIVFSEFGFAVFPIATTAAGAKAIRVPAIPKDDARMPHGHDLDAMAKAIRSDTRIVYVANPNNPTGTWFSDSDFDSFIAQIPPETLIVVDEAYHEYVRVPELSSAARLALRYPNLIVTRTFSKAYALAGLRVGYAISSPDVALVLESLRESFNVNSVALAAAEAALRDQDHVRDCAEWNETERDWLTEQLRKRGFEVMPSQTNFVLIDFGSDAAPIEAALYEQAVIVRPMGGYGLGECLRVTVGTRKENESFLAALT